MRDYNYNDKLDYMSAIEEVADWDEQRLLREEKRIEELLDCMVDYNFMLYGVIVLKLSLTRKEYLECFDDIDYAPVFTDSLLEALMSAKDILRDRPKSKYAWVEDFSEEFLKHLCPPRYAVHQLKADRRVVDALFKNFELELQESE